MINPALAPVRLKHLVRRCRCPHTWRPEIQQSGGPYTSTPDALVLTSSSPHSYHRSPRQRTPKSASEAVAPWSSLDTQWSPRLLFRTRYSRISLQWQSSFHLESGLLRTKSSPNHDSQIPRYILPRREAK